MSRAFARRLFRRPLAVHRLEDRLAPALFVAQPAQNYGAAVLENNGCVAAGDFNADGKQDVVLTNYGTTGPNPTFLGIPLPPDPGEKLTVLFGQGNGKFSTGATQVTVGSNQHVSFVAVADVTGDGKLDLVCSSTSSNTEAGMLTVFKGDGGGGFTKTQQIATGNSNAAWVGVGQLTTGDTNPDVVVCGFGKSDDNGNNLTGNNAAVFSGDGTGTFSLINTIAAGLAFIPTAGAIADFDADGDGDLVLTVPGVPPDVNAAQPEGSVYMFLGNGAGGFTAGNTFGTGGSLPIGIQAADVIGDSKPDLVIANAGDPDAKNNYANFGSGTAIGVLTNTGSGNFGAVQQLTFGLNSGGSTSVFAVQVADLNLDGLNDVTGVIYGNPNTGSASRVVAYLNNGKNDLLADPDTPYATSTTDGQYLAVADFDGNGTPDIVTVGAVNKVVTLLNQSVAPVATTTGLVSSLNPSTYGGSVTFTATVDAAGGAPTVGTVTFFDGAAAIGGPVALSGGVAVFATDKLVVATHTVTAKYSGGTGFSGSTSNAVSQVVNKASTLSNLVAAPTTVTAGSPVTLSVTVTSAGGTPAGTVTFFDSASALSGPVGLDASGKAVFQVSTLTVGPHTITATYSGNANFLNSTSNSVTVTVNSLVVPVTPTITLSAAPNPSTLGGAVTFTATLTAGSGTPTGEVTFFDGNNPLGAAVTLAGNPSKATFVTSTLGVGVNVITAKYAGATGFNPVDSNPLNQTVNPIPTAVTLGTDLTPSVTTQPVTFTATVSAGTGTPTGTVQFFDAGVAVSGLLPLGAGNKATFSTGTLSIGSHSITAQYSPGTADYAASTSAPLAQVVTQAGVTVTVSSSVASPVVSQAVTLTATLTKVPAIAPGPTGQVVFRLNGSLLDTVSVSGGVATLTTSGLPVNGGTITAEYLGDANFTGGTSPGFTQGVSKAGVTLTLTGGGRPRSGCRSPSWSRSASPRPSPRTRPARSHSG